MRVFEVCDVCRDVKGVAVGMGWVVRDFGGCARAAAARARSAASLLAALLVLHSI